MAIQVMRIKCVRIVCWVRRIEDSRVCESECDNTADSVWNDVDDDGVVDEEEKKEGVERIRLS